MRTRHRQAVGLHCLQGQAGPVQEQQAAGSELRALEAPSGEGPRVEVWESLILSGAGQPAALLMDVLQNLNAELGAVSENPRDSMQFLPSPELGNGQITF